MAVIGVYDSGIGGLTTAKVILDRFCGNDLYYLADNLNHPFGGLDEDKLKEIVLNGIKKVRAHADVVVLACNTASSVTEEKDVVKLLPPLKQCQSDAQNTLLMATPRTIGKSDTSDGFKIADTSELATLVEVQASINCSKGNLSMSNLLPYFAKTIFKFKGVKNVILGCSHYMYCKPEISRILGDVTFLDGNENLCKVLSCLVSANPEKPAKITFDFTAGSDEKKYKRILQLLMNSY